MDEEAWRMDQDEFAIRPDTNPRRLGLSFGNGDYRDLGYGTQMDPDRYRLMERAERFGERERRNPEPGHLFEPERRGMRGRGPRGYRRQDHSILEEISERFLRNPFLDATNVEIRVEAGDVTLKGTVDELDMKWVAEDIALEVSGVTDLTNEIRVVRVDALE